MVGLAKKLFFERSGAPILEKDDIKQRMWPFLKRMLKEGYIEDIDIYLAEQLLLKFKEDESLWLDLEASNELFDESLAALICHLSLAARKGHICVKIESGLLSPSPEEVWVGEEGSLTFLDGEIVKKFIFSAIEKMNDSLIEDNECSGRSSLKPIFKYHSLYYLHRYWHIETLFLSHFNKCLGENFRGFCINKESVRKKVAYLLQEGKLLEEQASAILKAAESSLTLISGGPGTGKTYTAAILVGVIWEALSIEERARFKISLAAPTGKAAANLTTSMQKALKLFEGFPCLTATTLHQMLGLNYHADDKFIQTLIADLIVIDESSMIDVGMMARFLGAVKPGTMVIFLGDQYQLSSVEAGSVFADLITYFKLRPERRNQVLEFKMCLRSDKKAIVELGQYIKEGRSCKAIDLMKQCLEEVKLYELEEKIAHKYVQEQLLNHIIPYFSKILRMFSDPSDLLNAFSSFRVLNPMRKGILGVDKLNEMIFKALNGNKRFFSHYAVPIMVVKNDYQRNLFNGEIGILMKDGKSEYALFRSSHSSSEMRKIPLLLMPPFEYAYCLSIHKSQGSEFDHVVLFLPKGSEIFGKEALYTGVTRARKQLDILSYTSVLKQMMTFSGLRRSGIVDRLSA